MRSVCRESSGCETPSCFSSPFEFWILLGSRRQCVRYGGNICWARIGLIFGGCHFRLSDSSTRTVSAFVLVPIVLVPIVLGLRASAPNPPHPRSQLLGPDAGWSCPPRSVFRAASSVGVNELPFWNSLGSRRQCVRYGGNICWARIVLIFCGCHSPRARTSSSGWVSVFVRRPIVLGLRASAPHPPDPRSQVLGPDAADRL